MLYFVYICSHAYVDNDKREEVNDLLPIVCFFFNKWCIFKSFYA